MRQNSSSWRASSGCERVVRAGGAPLPGCALKSLNQTFKMRRAGSPSTSAWCQVQQPARDLRVVMRPSGNYYVSTGDRGGLVEQRGSGGGKPATGWPLIETLLLRAGWTSTALTTVGRWLLLEHVEGLLPPLHYTVETPSLHAKPTAPLGRHCTLGVKLVFEHHDPFEMRAGIGHP